MSSRTFRLGERVPRPAGAVLADLRDPARWASALGGTWRGDHWSWTTPRPGACTVRRRAHDHGVEVHLAGDGLEATVSISAVDADPGECTVVADVAVSAAPVLPGAWWVELQREAAPRWLTALTAGAPAGTDPVGG